MAARRTTFGKMQRDRAKKAKASAKRERRQERHATPADEAEAAPEQVTTTGARLSESEIIDRLEVLHQRFDDGDIGFDDFEEQKAALLAHLSVE